MTSMDIQFVPGATIIAPSFDIEKAEKDGKNILFNNFLNGKKPLVLKFSGNLSTNGVNVSKFGDSEVASLGVELDEEAVAGFNTLQELVENYLVEKNLDEKYEVVAPLKNDKIYVKLRYDGKSKKWPFKTNVTINPTNPQSANLFQGQAVTVVCKCAGYLNIDTGKVGLYFNPTSFTFAK